MNKILDSITHDNRSFTVTINGNVYEFDPLTLKLNNPTLCFLEDDYNAFISKLDEVIIDLSLEIFDDVLFVENYKTIFKVHKSSIGRNHTSYSWSNGTLQWENVHKLSFKYGVKSLVLLCAMTRLIQLHREKMSVHDTLNMMFKRAHMTGYNYVVVVDGEDIVFNPNTLISTNQHKQALLFDMISNYIQIKKISLMNNKLVIGDKTSKRDIVISLLEDGKFDWKWDRYVESDQVHVDVHDEIQNGILLDVVVQYLCIKRMCTIGELYDKN